MGCTDTGTTMLHRFIRYGEPVGLLAPAIPVWENLVLCKVMANHFGFKLNRIEDLKVIKSLQYAKVGTIIAHLAVVDTDNTSNHFRDDNHVS